MSEQVVIVGKMRDDVFHASQMQMKCPSKYVEEEVQASQ
jgi:cytochrome c-type biogenesis protein CcmE